MCERDETAASERIHSLAGVSDDDAAEEAADSATPASLAFDDATKGSAETDETVACLQKMSTTQHSGTVPLRICGEQKSETTNRNELLHWSA